MTTEESGQHPSPRTTKKEEGKSYWLEFFIVVTIFALGALILMVSK